MKRIAILITLLVTCIQTYGYELDFTFRLKLKPPKDKSYLATEDPEMKALVTKHKLLAFELTYPGAKNPELLLYYDL